MTAKPVRRVGVPGELTRSQYVLVFCVPVLSIVVLMLVLFVEGRAESRRDRERADVAVERFLEQKLKEGGAGAVAVDPNLAWICIAVQDRADGPGTTVQPYNKLSRDLARRFVAELC
jgi:hypothetical protein